MRDGFCEMAPSSQLLRQASVLEMRGWEMWIFKWWGKKPPFASVPVFLLWQFSKALSQFLKQYFLRKIQFCNIKYSLTEKIKKTLWLHDRVEFKNSSSRQTQGAHITHLLLVFLGTSGLGRWPGVLPTDQNQVSLFVTTDKIPLFHTHAMFHWLNTHARVHWKTKAQPKKILLPY